MSMPDKPLYRRILIKMSGEVLMGDGSTPIDPKVLDRLAKEVFEVHRLGVQIGIVIGGGNIYRGKTLQEAGITRISGDYMGMLGTMINALALRDAFERAGLEVRIFSALPMSGFADHFNSRKAIHDLERHRVVIFAAGTGNPLVTTDSAASLRGIEIEADVVMKATNVDGIYSDDPVKNPNAVKYETLSYQEALDKQLAVMDLSAFCQCRDHNMTLRVFNIKNPGALLRAVLDPHEGTTVN